MTPDRSRPGRLSRTLAASTLVMTLSAVGGEPYAATAAIAPVGERSVSSAAGTLHAAPEASPGWVWPVELPRSLVEGFVAPATPYAAGHRGIDVGASAGSPAYAAAGGVVSFSGVVVDRPLVSITHADGLVSSIEPVTPTVSTGDRVSAGDRIGSVSVGGHCGDGCVHFGVRLYGEYLNPLAMLGDLERAVLLPLSP